MPLVRLGMIALRDTGLPRFRCPLLGPSLPLERSRELSGVGGKPEALDH